MQSLHNNCRYVNERNDRCATRQHTSLAMCLTGCHRSRAISPLDRALQTPPSLRPYITFSAAKPCGYTHKALHAQPAHPAARRPTAAQAASVTTASSQEATQAFERLCSIPGVAGHVRIHLHPLMHTAKSLVQVALQEGEYGRGMMLTQPVQSGTSAAPGVACSVPLHLSLVLVKEKEMFSRGPLEWHERCVVVGAMGHVLLLQCTTLHSMHPTQHPTQHPYIHAFDAGICKHGRRSSTPRCQTACCACCVLKKKTTSCGALHSTRTSTARLSTMHASLAGTPSSACHTCTS